VKCFADTSLLCALYRKQGVANSAKQVVTQLKKSSLVISDTVEFEFRASLQLQVFRYKRGDQEGLSAQEAKEAKERFAADVGAGVIKIVPSEWAQVVAYATDLAERLSNTVGARSMDIVHVATAIMSQCDCFATFDDEQWRLALSEKLIVLPDDLPSVYRKRHDFQSPLSG
jgi:predicted nucleic acid-binding protein